MAETWADEMAACLAANLVVQSDGSWAAQMAARTAGWSAAWMAETKAVHWDDYSVVRSAECLAAWLVARSVEKRAE